MVVVSAVLVVVVSWSSWRSWLSVVLVVLVVEVVMAAAVVVALHHCVGMCAESPNLALSTWTLSDSIV